MSTHRMKSIGRQQFSAGLISKDAWFLQGRWLLTSAEVLLEQLWEYKPRADALTKEKKHFPAGDPDLAVLERSHMEPAIALLLAYAFENFFKGLWVFQNPDDVREAATLPPVFRGRSSHDLVVLANETDVKLSAAEVEALRTLSEFSRWRGRYGIEVTAERNANAWASAGDLMFVSREYPGPVVFPEEVYSVINKIAVAAGIQYLASRVKCNVRGWEE